MRHVRNPEDHYRTFLRDSSVTSNVIGKDFEEFMGVQVCDSDDDPVRFTDHYNSSVKSNIIGKDNREFMGVQVCDPE